MLAGDVESPDSFDPPPDNTEPVTPAERYENLLTIFAQQIGGVDQMTLLAARAHVLTLPDMQARQTLTEVIDGQLALRGIAGVHDAGPRS
jgi:hypothetical protein